jgi:hypothetical protein
MNSKLALAALALALVPAACQAPLRSAHAGGYYYAPAPWAGPQRFNQSLELDVGCSSPFAMARSTRWRKRASICSSSSCDQQPTRASPSCGSSRLSLPSSNAGRPLRAMMGSLKTD